MYSGWSNLMVLFFSRLAAVSALLIKAGFTAVILLNLLHAQAAASEAVDLFTVAVEVDSETRSERAAASKTALKILLARVTGDKQATRRYPLLASSLGKADRYIVSFSYERKSMVANLPFANDYSSQAINAHSQELMQLKLVFQADAIMSLLREAGAPYWQANRPGVLVWLAAQSGGSKVLVNADAFPHQYAELARIAKARGIPLIQPLLDLEEMGRIDASDVWNTAFETINRASRRYDNGVSLVGKLSQASDKSWLGQWTLVYRGQRQVLPFKGQSLAAYFAQGADMAADAMAADYAVAANQQQQFGNILTIEVSGVTQHGDYVSLTEYLRKIPALKRLQLSRIEGERCYFTVDTADDISNIRSLIQLDKRLKPQASANSIYSSPSVSSSSLRYIWQMDR